MNGSGVCVSDEEEEDEEKVHHVFATLWKMKVILKVIWKLL